MNRRKFIKGLSVLGLAGAFDAKAATRDLPAVPVDESDANEFVFSRFKFLGHRRAKDEWDILPQGDENLLEHLRRVTNIPISKRSWKERVVRVDDFEKMYKTPFIFMTGEVDFSFNQAEAMALREFFKRGGFLYADDCLSGTPERRFFYEAMLREIGKVLPRHEFTPVPYQHEIYHCFYDIPDGSPWWPGKYVHLKTVFPDRGLFYKNRLVCFLTSNDQHCSWARRHQNAIKNYDAAIKMGTNIVIYSLTH